MSLFCGFEISYLLPLQRIRNGEFPLYSLVQVKSGAVQEMAAGKL
jgi:hypothetical protein